MKIRTFTDISRIEAIINEWSYATGLIAFAIDSDGIQLTFPGAARKPRSKFAPESAPEIYSADFCLDITLENGSVVGSVVGGRVLPIRESALTEHSDEDMRVSAGMLRKMVSLVVTSCYADYLYNTEIKALNDQLRLDPMTKVYTKSFMSELIYDALETGENGALFVIDIDDFKHINDTYGHTVGDEVIITIADTLKEIFGDDNYVSRFGGDEFTAFVTKNCTKSELMQLGNRVCDAIRNLSFEQAPGFRTSVSIGCAPCPACGSSIDELFLSADKALYRTKGEGKNGCSVSEGKRVALA